LNPPIFLLPVYNAQANLEAAVSEVLELAAEAPGPFELVILDDGSTDETALVARDLAAQYPQVRLLRHPVRLGLAEAIQTGLDNLAGQIVLVEDHAYRLDADDLITLAELRAGRPTRGSKDTPAPLWLKTLLARTPQKADSRLRFRLLSRPAFERLRMEQAAGRTERIDDRQTPARAPSGRSNLFSAARRRK
jgi:glycosyltransferase involved in cell wall biosynthesis